MFSPDLVLRFSALDVTQPNMELVSLGCRLGALPHLSLYLPFSVPDLPHQTVVLFTGLGVSNMLFTCLTVAETPSGASLTSFGPFNVLSVLHSIAINMSNHLRMQ